MTPPTGTVTFLFSDIEGSSRLWERHPVDMATALARHDEIVRAEIAAVGGHVFKTVGDAFCAAFATPDSALSAAREAQRRLFAEEWGATGPLRVRMGLHAGPAEFRDGDYFGGTLNRVARICAAGHGGQILVSGALAELASLPPAELVALGDFRLRNLNRVESIFQLNTPGLPTDFPPLRSRQSLPHNLPVAVTTFIGREREVEEIKSLLARSRLLTLLGTGGTGKTRLATETARELLESHPDGVWLVEMAAATSAEEFAALAATALGVREETGRTLDETLATFLRERETLLVVDNCEHLLPDLAKPIGHLLRGSPKLRVLATSRQALRLPGETTLPVRPLETFDVWHRLRDRPVRAEDIAGFPAVRLFIERAGAVLPGFALTDANARDIARICWRLDGIPLAIELAAARLRVLSPAQIAERLNDQFKLLKGGNTVLPHQQTLRALIDWSYQLLDEPERLLFHRLGIFAGGRTLDAVESVCADEKVDAADVLDLLQQLADKSLIFIESGADGAPRYTMIESVWQYAREKLAESGELDTLRARHFDYFHSLVADAAPALFGPEPGKTMQRLTSETLNLRFALDHAATPDCPAEAAFAFVGALERFWEIGGNLEDARRHIEAVLERPATPTLACAKAFTCAARVAWAQDRYDDAVALANEAITRLTALGETIESALVSGYLGFIEFSRGETAAARLCFAHAEETGRQSSDERLLALSAAGRGSLAAAEGHLDEALAVKREALERFRRLGDRWIVGYSLWGLAQAALALQKPDEARAALREWAGIARDTGNRWSAAYLVQLLADTARLEGKPELAARLFGAAEYLRERLGIRLTPTETAVYEKSLAALRESLPSETLATLWEAGRHLRPEAAMAAGLAD